MRIACPSCAAEYEVPDAALAGGPRRLRCARCGHLFLAELPAPPVEAPPPDRPAPAAGAEPPDLGAAMPPAEGARAAAAAEPPDAAAEPPAEAPARPPPARGPSRLTPIEPPLPAARDLRAAPPDRVALLGWAMTGMLLVATVAAAYLWRYDIMAAWPPAARLFGALDLD